MKESKNQDPQKQKPEDKSQVNKSDYKRTSSVENSV